MFIRLFGRVTVEGPSSEVEAGSPTQKRLLALLAIDVGRVVSLDRLFDSMWDADPPAKAEEMIRIYVSRLRKVLEGAGGGDGPLRTVSGGYQLDLPRNSVDIHRFEELVRAGESRGDPYSIREAMSLWRDEPLVEFTYEEWAHRVRARLDEHRLNALETALGYEIERGVRSSTLAEIEDLVSDNPLRERLWTHLILGLYRAGRQADAFRAYDRCRDELAEVGLEPGPHLLAVVDAISSPARPVRVAASKGVPAEWDRFIGREADLSQLAVAVEGNRLVTVVGPGGSGKTRLVNRYAGEQPGPVWWADLSTVQIPEVVEETLLATLGSGVDRPLVDVADEAVGQGSGLLVIDNCEHLIDVTVDAVERLLSSVPGIRLLTTSREPLRMRGEYVIRLDSLALPEDGAPTTVDGSESGSLFIDRARSSSGLIIDEGTAPLVAQILRQLDGMPLAIELAAARLDSVRLDELAGALFEELAAAGAGQRTILARHRTLEATLEWSYRLLDEEEQSLFRRLGSVVGEFDESLVTALGSSSEVLHSLVSKSMVVSSQDGLYRLLVPVRSYARDLLVRTSETDESVTMRDHHYLELADDLVGDRRFADARYQNEFRLIRGNLIPAIDGLVERNPLAAAPLISALAEYWQLLGLYAEGQRAMSSVLEHPLSPSMTVPLLLQLARSQSQTHSLRTVTETIEEALALAVGEDDGSLIALAHNVLGNIRGVAGDMLGACDTLEVAVDLYARWRPEEWYIPVTNLAAGLAWRGQIDPALELLDRMVRAELPDASLAYVPGVAGIAHRVNGEWDTADGLLEEATDGFDRHRSVFHLCLALVERALVRLALGDVDGAEVLALMALSGGRDEEVPKYAQVRAGRVLAEIMLHRGDPTAAGGYAARGLSMARAFGLEGGVAELLDTASVIATEDDPGLGSSLAIGSDDLRQRLGLARDPHEAGRRQGISSFDSTVAEPVERFLERFEAR